jgi:hypothetical protein
MEEEGEKSGTAKVTEERLARDVRSALFISYLYII